MSQGNWYDRNSTWVAISLYSLFFCLFVGYISYSKGYQRSDQEHQSDYTAHYESQINEQDCIAKPTSKEAVQCYKESAITARDHTRAEYDLSAQREMADWAELMLWSSFISGFLGIGVTGFGLIYIKGSLDAAVEANQLAHSDSILLNPPRYKLTRAMIWDGGKDIFSLPIFEKGKPISAMAFLVNYGPYKPKEVSEIYFEIMIVKDGIIPMTHAYRIKSDNIRPKIPDGVDPLTSPIRLHARTAFPDDFHILDDGDFSHTIYLWGWVEYQDEKKGRGYYFCKRYIPKEQRFEGDSKHEIED